MWKKSTRLRIIATFVALLLVPTHTVHAQTDPLDIPKINFGDFEYVGGIRIPANDFGISSMNSGHGNNTFYNDPVHGPSLFMIGHRYQDAVAQFALPTPVNSTDPNDFPLATNVQPFANFKSRLAVNPKHADNSDMFDEVIGFHVMDTSEGPKGVVQYYAFYDASGVAGLQPSLAIVEDIHDLANSSVTGMFGTQHSSAFVSGYMADLSPEIIASGIFDDYTHVLGGGQTQSIGSRNSHGPTYKLARSSDMLSVHPGEDINAPTLTHYTLNDPIPGYNHWGGSGPDEIWNVGTKALDTVVIGRTFISAGLTAGQNSGWFYKNPNQPYSCGGYCPYDQSDYNNMVYLYDVEDLEDGYRGITDPKEILPYSYGPLSVPVTMNSNQIDGLAYDKESGLLYMSFHAADRTQGRYAFPPIILVYRINNDRTPPQISNVNVSGINATMATVTWDTNEYATSTVEYGPTSSLGSSKSVSGTAQSHSVGLDGLTANTTYHYRAVSTDNSGNTTNDTIRTFTTGAPDTTPPIISGIGVRNVTARSAIIDFTTNEPTRSYVEYGTSTNYGKQTTTSQLETNFSVSLSGLDPDTTHHARIVSRDDSGNERRSNDIVFTTIAAPPSLIARLRFDENSGNTADGELLTGTITGASWTDGRVNSALAFDGAGDYVDLGIVDINSSDGLTAAAHIYINNVGSIADNRILGMANGTSDNNHNLMLSTINGNGGSTFRARVKTTNGETITVTADSGTFQSNTWYHVAMVYDGSRVILYVDGQEVGSANKTGDVVGSNTNRLYVGANRPNERIWNGRIDEVVLHRRALSAAEIQALANPNSSAPDTENPSVLLTAPADGATVSNSVTVSANASDNVGVTGVQFLLDGANLGAEDTSAPYNYSWDTTLTSNGSHVLSAMARDAAGNIATSATRTVTVNNVGPPPANRAPTATMGTPRGIDRDPNTPGLQVYEGDTITYTASASDPDGDVLDWEWRYRSTRAPGDTTVDSGSGPITDYPYTYPVGSEGHTYTWVIRVSDAEFVVEDTVTVRVIPVPDTTPPVISNVRVSNITATSFTVTWDTDESSSSQVEYGLDTTYGNSTTEDTNEVTNHTVVVSGLTGNTFYHLRVISKDTAGNVGRSQDVQVTTLGPPEVCVRTMLERFDKHNSSDVYVRIVHVPTGQVRLEKTVSSDEEGKMFLNDNALRSFPASDDYEFTVKPKAHFARKITARDFVDKTGECVELPASSFGDVDGNGVSDLRDLNVLMKHFGGQELNAGLTSLFGDRMPFRAIIWGIKSYIENAQD